MRRGEKFWVLRIKYFIPKDSKYYTKEIVSWTEDIGEGFVFYQMNSTFENRCYFQL